MVFNAFKENCPRDRKIVNFDDVCKFQRGNVMDDCCLLWKSFSIIGSMWKRHLTQNAVTFTSSEGVISWPKNLLCLFFGLKIIEPVFTNFWWKNIV